jgi:DNA invertase Pin-like site-specific DNA recombinase
MSKKPPAYSYIRISTPEQLRGDSLRRQLEASTAYAFANGLELVGVLELPTEPFSSVASTAFAFA